MLVENVDWGWPPKNRCISLRKAKRYSELKISIKKPLKLDHFITNFGA
jgi:hypothetical protein